MRCKTLSFVVLFGFLCAHSVFGMTSTNFRIDWDSMNTGGNDIGSSTNYAILDTVGDNATGTSTSSNYSLSAGYRAIEGQSTLSFIVSTQANGSQIAFTAFSNSLKTVTVNSTSSYSVNDYIVVVENKSFTQKIAIGKITNISSDVMTVDAFSGDGSVMSAVSSGGDDFVYKLSGSAASFGTLSTAGQPTTVTMSNVLTTGSTGYSVYMYAGSTLRTSAGAVIANVADGAVSLGSEEYGVSVTGTSAVGSGSDFAIPTSQLAIQSRAGATPVTPDRMGIIYKVAITAGTTAGSYSQNVFYTLTANY